MSQEPAIAQANRPPAPPGKPVTIDIAAISDFHGQLKATSSSGGVLGVSGVIEALRAENPETIFVANGDSVGGSAYESAILEDAPTLDLLNEMGLTLSNAGNHEFDKGWVDFRDRIMEHSDFPSLNANLSNTPELDDYSLVEVDGVSVAFVGTMTEEFPSLVNPDGIKGIAVTDPVSATNAVAHRLSDGRERNGEADVIIALTHAGYQGLADGDFSSDVDAVFTGHTHNSFEGTLLTDEGNAIPVLQPQYAGATVSLLSLTYKPATGKAGNSKPRIMSFETDTIATAGYVDGATPEVRAIYDAALAAAAEAGKAVVGAISDDLLQPVGGTRGNESTIGTFLANVALWQGEQITDADIGVINSGGIRASFLYAGDTTDNPLNVDGAVTYAEAFTVQPFGNTMAYIDLTGEQVDLLLEQQWQDGKSRPMLRLGISDNVSYVFDPTRAQFDRVTDIFIDGDPLDPTATYTVAGNSFLLAGGDSFFVFEDGANYVDTGVIDLQSLLDYLAELRELGELPVQPVLEQASTGFAVDGLEVTISSLMFTNGETSPATVELWVDGVMVDSAAIDAEVDISVPDPDDTTDPEDTEARSLVDLTGIATLTVDSPIEAGAEIRILTDDGFTDVTFIY